MVLLYGDLPKYENIVFTSCDVIYFIKFIPALAYSCKHFNINLHVNVDNPDGHVFSLATILKNDIPTLTISFHDEKNSFEADPRVYHACKRFIIAPNLIKIGAKKLLIIDTDSIFNKAFEWPVENLGLYLREPLPNCNKWETYSTHVAAGMVYYTDMSISFADRVAQSILQNKPQWFIDQASLWESYNHHINNLISPLTFKQFTDKDMDWEFKQDSVLWTGKGERKYNNQIYIDKAGKYTSMMANFRERFWGE